MRRLISATFTLALVGLLSVSSAWAQRVSPYESHYRVIAIIPTVTRANGVKAPQYLDNPAVKLLGFSSILSPDRSKSICLLVVAKRSDLGPIVNDPAVVVIDKAITPKAQIETTLRAINPQLVLDRLKVRVP